MHIKLFKYWDVQCETFVLFYTFSQGHLDIDDLMRATVSSQFFRVLSITITHGIKQE